MQGFWGVEWVFTNINNLLVRIKTPFRLIPLSLHKPPSLKREGISDFLRRQKPCMSASKLTGI